MMVDGMWIAAFGAKPAAEVGADSKKKKKKKKRKAPPSGTQPYAHNAW